MLITPRVRRQKFWIDRDGNYTLEVDDEDELSHTFDLTEEITGETINAVVWENASGPALSAPNISGGLLTFTQKGTGTATMKVTTSTARILHYYFKFIDPRNLSTSDYDE
jgi:hypothetical protein